MCLALPGRVLEVIDPDKRIIRVDVLGTPRNVTTGLLEPVASGDWVLIQTGFAVEKISEAEALETRRLLEEMEAAFEEEVRSGP